MWDVIKPTTGVRQVGWIASLLMLILLLEVIKLWCFP